VQEGEPPHRHDPRGHLTRPSVRPQCWQQPA